MIFLQCLGFVIYFIGIIILIYYITTFFMFKGWENPPYFPLMGKVKKQLIQETEKLLQNGKSLHIGDLGCGDGRLIKPLAKKFPQHQFYGYEWDQIPFHMAKVYLKNQKNVSLIYGDFLKQDLKHLDIIVCYLGSTGLEKSLKQKFKKGALILSAIFPIKGWTPIQIIHSNLYGLKTKIFIYKK